MRMDIRSAQQEDHSAVLQLLQQSDLPQDGLSDHWATTLVARDGSQVVGSAALELYGASALLRSVAVEPSRRGQGLGQRLTQAALDLAKQRGVKAVYLLTETAAHFFARFGFRRISRSDVLPEVQRSVEFTHACPKSAQVMMVELSTAISHKGKEGGTYG